MAGTCCATEGPSLQDFKESGEERVLQKILKLITNNPEIARFINLDIHNCNAEDGTSFDDAYITLRVTNENLRRNRTEFVNDYIERTECQVLELMDILETNVLKAFQTRGVDGLENFPQPICHSFLVLLTFLRDVTKETLIRTGLAHHLFSRLVPNNKYEVDDDAKQLPNTCPCGCDGSIYRGDTSLGTKGTWHGRVDILVNDVIAITIEKEQTMTENEDEDTVEDEPQNKKQRKLEIDESCEMCVDVKGNRRHETVLLDVKVMNKILTKAITNGFAQVNANKSTFSHFLIPTFGATSDYVTVCLYDPEVDCLFHIDEELELWREKEIRRNLDPETIVIIWLFLNFTVLTKKNLVVPDINKSGFHKRLKKEDLKIYRETKAKANFFSHTPEARPWKKTTKKVMRPISPS
ncbi:uncharacterized protein [Argopecten irradians]|uniref:uncharacterized protein isoform X2 n=1 Tax=Argopecten irradians TaxID=31199 RepID=UPI00371D2A9F